MRTYAIALYCVCCTNLFWLSSTHEDELERPYRIKYADLSDMQLIFAVEDEYDHFMHWLDLGGSDYEEMSKFLFRMESYIAELRHRQTGNIATLNMTNSLHAERYLTSHQTWEH